MHGAVFHRHLGTQMVPACEDHVLLNGNLPSDLLSGFDEHQFFWVELFIFLERCTDRLSHYTDYGPLASKWFYWHSGTSKTLQLSDFAIAGRIRAP